MSMDPSQRKRAQRLIAELHDGVLSPDRIAELQELLSQNESVRSDYVNFVMLHALLEAKHEPALRGASASEIDVDFAFLVDATASKSSANLSLGSQANFYTLAGAKEQEAGQRREHRSMLANTKPYFALAACACILLVLGSLTSPLWQDGESDRLVASDDYIAVLSNTNHARWLANPPGPAPARLQVGSSLQLTEGLAEVTFSSGAVVVVRGPADLQLLSPMHVVANRGTVRARVGEEATGFVIETPNADVVDLGTEFGVNVSEAGTTDVVVFEGAVDLAYHATSSELKGRRRAASESATIAAHRKRLHSGEALHVNKEGTVRRIVSVDSDLYPVTTVQNNRQRLRPPVIRRVTDNIRDPENSQYYQIVHGGLWEDTRAFVDRFHEWNGIDKAGLPDFLLGADYVMTFNSDKWQSDIEIEVELGCPAMLYVFYDNRREVPDWLSTKFVDTGIDIGVDEGFPGNPRILELNSTGPGNSINTHHSVWKLAVQQPGLVQLGPLATQEKAVNMYGIAAVPLEVLDPKLPSETSPTTVMLLKSISNSLLAHMTR